MYIHIYQCSACQKIVTFLHEAAADPLAGKFRLHSDIKGGTDGITDDITWADEQCPGTPIYCGTVGNDKERAVVRVTNGHEQLVSKVSPGWRAQQQQMQRQQEQLQKQTAADVSLEYCKNPGQHNTISAAVDINSPATRKKGVNAHGRQRAQLHAGLQTILRNKVNKLEEWSVANCAEIYAVDELLNAGVAAANIRVHSRDQKGKSKPPCDTCQGWLEPAEGRFDMQVYKIRQ